MIGAIIGDIAGSRFERHPSNYYDFELFHHACRFTDDTVTTAAVASAIINGEDYGQSIHTICARYPRAGYGRSFKGWLYSNDPQPYNSFGNGAAMRVSPVAFAFRDMDECLRQAELTALPTHNHPEGIKGAQATAMAMRMFLNLTDPTTEVNSVIDTVAARFNYNVDIERCTVENRFDVTCQGTVPVALWIIKESTSFEDAIRRAVSLGADADTLGAIVGSIAETIWGVPARMRDKAFEYLTDDILRIIIKFYELYDIHTII